ncbi:MAG TPA: Ig-like domain-containing protein [Oligoflexia bacterium]|nr:Ig-like domain-containing protein [Oligoflexia bacterium]HMP27089.1 Ig-like domain-containing protein [Oligoflexia bacterium]
MRIILRSASQFVLLPFFFTLSFFVEVAFSQLTITEPSSDIRLRSCKDLPVDLFGDPWDMSSYEDVNYYTGSDITNILSPSFNSGFFNFVTAAANAATFYLFSPVVQGSVPVGGRYGVNYPFDSTRYSYLTINMFSSLSDPAPGGIKLLYNRDVNYTTNRTVTQTVPVRAGWKTYGINLLALPISAGESSNASPWSAGSITGLGIMPTQKAGADVSIDHILLQDPSSCGNESLEYTASGGSRFLTFFLDNDDDPTNGYGKIIANGLPSLTSGSQSFSTLEVPPGDYKVYGFESGDYASHFLFDPYHFANSNNVLVTASISNMQYVGGKLVGTASGGAATIYLRLADGGIDATRFKKLSFKVARTTTENMAIHSDVGGMIINHSATHVGGGVYHVDLSTWSSWSGTRTQFIFQPVLTSGGYFELDWLSLSSDSFYSAEPTINATARSNGFVKVNHPPIVSIKEPNLRGGEAIKALDLDSNDFALHANLRNDPDPNFGGEPYTAVLPDSRLVYGQRGDFFKGTNILGNDDPIDYISFPHTAGFNFPIDANRYKYLCLKQLIDRPLDVCLGSITRPVWLGPNGIFSVGVAWVSIYNIFSNNKWYEYCVDLSTIGTHGADQLPWAGNISAFRIDPHEFSRDTCGADGNPTGNPISATYYYDYIKLRKSDESHGVFNITYQLRDLDDPSATVSFYYTPVGGTSSTFIGSAGAGANHYSWNTTAIPAGDYLISAVANDGIQTYQAKASGILKIVNDGAGYAPPVLSIDSPRAGDVICSNMQVKGFALEPSRLEEMAAVQVFIDGNLARVIFPPYDYSPVAKSAYPLVESSNSGFNFTIDSSNLFTGPHTVVIRAISTAGSIASSGSISVNKSPSGCTPPREDPPPSGQPLVVDNINNGDGGGNNPQFGSPRRPNIKTFSINRKKNNLTVRIDNGGESDQSCNLSLMVNKKRSIAGGIRGKLFANPPAGRLTAALKKFQVNSRKVKLYYLYARKECQGGNINSSIKTIRPFQQKGVSTVSKIAKLLSKLKLM